jgi:REP element-mobilizing transposase RayT
MWNDADAPIAYLITFRTYGTWLHGDERGSIDRHNNSFHLPKYSRQEHWNSISSKRMTRDPVTLSSQQRAIVESAIRETCTIRRWNLYAVNIRTNHGHVVVSTGGRDPSTHLNAFKANATRQLREAGCWTLKVSPWSDKGSQRWLWTEKHLADAVDYVLLSQGHELPQFE